MLQKNPHAPEKIPTIRKNGTIPNKIGKIQINAGKFR